MEEQMEEQKIDYLEELSNFIFTSKYARYREDKQRRETWEETVERVLNMHLTKFAYLAPEHIEKIKWAFELVKEKRVVPSLRSCQFGGEAVFAKNERLYNCASLHITSLRNFSEFWFLLLCGTGVTCGVSKKAIAHLPDLVNSESKTGTILTYVVEDTIEGWADSVEALLACYFRNTPYSGRKIVYDYSRVRPKGAPLKTGGGKAPGHKGLKQAHIKIKKILDYIIEERKQTRLEPINAYDILMHCADAVLSGGIRRAATMAIFDLDDDAMMKAKVNFKVTKSGGFEKRDDGKWEGFVYVDGANGGFVNHKYEIVLTQYEYELVKNSKEISWVHIEPQRARSNNSVLLMRDQTTFEQFEKIVENTKQFGEPGYIFSNDIWALTNPCVSGDAIVNTDIGNIRMDELVARVSSGEKIKALSYNEKEEVFEFQNITWGAKTRENASLIEVTDSSFTSVKLTPDHKVLTKNGGWKPAEELSLCDTLINNAGGLPEHTSTISIKMLDKKEDVYDITVENNHNFLANGIVVHNCAEVSFIPITKDGRHGVSFCNLTSQNGALIDSLDKFLECTEAATIIGTLQAAYTNFPYLSQATEELAKEEALLGVSITGFMDNPDILLNPRNQYVASQLAVKVNQEWAKILYISQAARVTVAKPEGCLVPNSLIPTSEGILTLEEIGDTEGDKWQDHNIKVIGKDGWKKSSKFHVNGYAKTIKLGFDSGLSVEGTLKHKFFILTPEGNTEWKQLSDMRIGDKVLYRVGGYDKSEYVKLSSAIYPANRAVPILQPEIVDEELAWALGVIYGDGSVHKGGLRVSGDVRYQEELKKLSEIMLRKFGVKHRVCDYQHRDENDHRCQYYFSSVQLLAFLRLNNILKPKTADMCIPEKIRTSPASVISAFIDGYLVADGCDKKYESQRGDGHKSIVTISKQMAEELVIVSRAIGKDCSFRIMPATESSFGTRDRYWIAFRKGKDSNWTKQKVEKRKDWEALEQLGMKEFYVDHVVSMEEGESYTYDIEVDEVHNYIANSYVSHNTSSLLLKSASGIHPHHAHRYFRRVQCNKQDNVYKHFKKFNPHACEESVWSANKTDDIVTFPLTVSDNAMVKSDLTALKHLELVKSTQENWVIPGTTPANTRNIANNVSSTILVGQDEWEGVTRYIYDNRKFFTAVSLLPSSGDKDYQQAPLEKILPEDEEKWNQLVSNWKTVDYSTLTEKDDKTSLVQTLSCAGGACDVDFSKDG